MHQCCHIRKRGMSYVFWVFSLLPVAELGRGIDDGKSLCALRNLLFCSAETKHGFVLKPISRPVHISIFFSQCLKVLFYFI